MEIPSKIKISICSTGAYAPSSNCGLGTDGMELKAERSIARFLKFEKENLKKLNRPLDPELGDVPP
jgi:hypothetical protein